MYALGWQQKKIKNALILNTRKHRNYLELNNYLCAHLFKTREIAFPCFRLKRPLTKFFSPVVNALLC